MALETIAASATAATVVQTTTAPQAIEHLRTLWVIGHKVTPIPAGDRVAALHVATPAGTPGPPPHYHADSAESFYVVAGRLGVMAAGEWTSLGPGGYVEVPRGVVHTFRNEGDEDVQTITIFEVPGFENWFEEFGYDMAEPGAYEKSVSQDTIQRVLEGSSRHHMIIAAAATT